MNQQARRTAHTLTKLLVVVMLVSTTLFVAPEQAEARGLHAILDGPVTVKACKASIPSIYGPLWRVTFYAHNSSNRTWGAGVVVTRNRSETVHSWARSVRPGRTVWGTVYISQLLPDQLGVSTHRTGVRGPSRAGISPSRISNC